MSSRTPPRSTIPGGLQVFDYDGGGDNFGAVETSSRSSAVVRSFVTDSDGDEEPHGGADMNGGDDDDHDEALDGSPPPRREEGFDYERERQEIERQAWEQQKQAQVVEGESWFLVPKNWYSKWESYAEYGGHGDIPNPGSIDFSGITESDGKLKNGLTGFDYEMITTDTWDVLKQRYGGSGVEIERKAVYQNVGAFVAVYPMRVTVRRAADQRLAAKHLKVFAHETLAELKKKACKALKVDAASAQICEDIFDETQDEPEDMEQTLARVPVIEGANFVIVTESDPRKKPKPSPPDEQEGCAPKPLDSMADAFSAAANLRDAARSAGSSPAPQPPAFAIGDRVQRRDHSAHTSSPAWGVGIVTQLEPELLVTFDDDDDSFGHRWDEVRPLPEGWRPANSTRRGLFPRDGSGGYGSGAAAAPTRRRDRAGSAERGRDPAPSAAASTQQQHDGSEDDPVGPLALV